MDSPNGAEGSEEIFYLAEQEGLHCLEVRPWPASTGGPTGSYTLRIVELRPADPADRNRAQGSAAYNRARQLEAGGAISSEEIAAEYRRAAHLWHRARSPRHEAEARYRLGRQLASSSPPSDAAAMELARSADLWQKAGSPARRARALLELGKLHRTRHEWAAAEQSLRQALEQWQGHSAVVDTAVAANDLAAVLEQRRRYHEAIELYTEATRHWRHLGHREGLATTSVNLGILYATVGDYQRAYDLYMEALDLVAGDRASTTRAVALTKLGDVLLWTQRAPEALERYRQALSMRQRLDDERGVAVTLSSIGLAEIELDRPRSALDHLRRAVSIFRRVDDVAAQAVTTHHLAYALERLGQRKRARETFEAALELARVASHRHAEASTLLGLARLERDAGELTAAQRRLEASLEIVEAIRERNPRADLRSSYLASRLQHYEELIDLLAERERRQPGRGYAARAFEVAERARARNLLERVGAAPGTVQVPGPLLRRISDLHCRLLSSGRGEEPPVARRAELAAALDDYRQGRADAVGAPTEVPALPSLAEVRRQLLDRDTLLLVYSLGERRSHVWAISTERAHLASSLPGRESIEAAARRAYEALANSRFETARDGAGQAAASLGRMLLLPVAPHLDKKRLVIVAPEALQYIPFSVLPHPHRREPLVADHEIVYLPSVAVLAAQRQNLAGRVPAAGKVAVVADPIFDADDERLPPGVRSRASVSLGSSCRAGFQRLEHTGREAAEIARLAAGRSVLVASGLDARRDLVTRGNLGRYSILHFATHGLADEQFSELSALALSTLDSSGRPIDGLLRAFEIAELDLPVELVVLSACRTALGHEVRGEGLVGLSHGFLAAGSRAVVVSLWEVSDRSTRELMDRFYRGLLEQGLSPSEALQAAQLSLAREARWQSPSDWAGFVLYGDWR